jgi:putative FmdB family regulatory protein
MPEYMYRCQSCKNEFSVILTISEREDREHREEIKCPKCESQKVSHLIEPFNVTTSKKS